MATKRLSDLDGQLAKATLGTQIDGDDSTPLTDGFYIADVVLATGSGLPTGIAQGYTFYASTASATTPATGESVTPITFTAFCFVQNATIEFSKDELESTTLCDDVKTYLVGRSDITGSFDGVTTIGDASNSGTAEITQKFIDTVTQTADLSTATITEIDNGAIYLQLDVNKESTVGENTAFYLLPALLISYSAGVTQGSVQTINSGFRIAADDNVNTQYFELQQPVV